MTTQATTTVIECSTCKAKVQAQVLAERVYSGGNHGDPFKYLFLECTHCQETLLGISEHVDFGDETGWTYPERKWPEPEDPLPGSIPRSVRRALDEARRCLSTNAYMATAVMCGRAVEALCKDKTRAKTLAEGLNRLLSEKIIDEKLFSWSEALRKERNIGAHAGETEVSWQDARDVLDFAIAISEYVYVLDEKYKAYLARKADA